MTKEEVRMFLNSIDNIRDKTLFTLMYSYGLRAEEARRLKIGSITLDKRNTQDSIMIEAVKGGKSGIHSISVDISKLLRKYFKTLESLDEDSPLFSSRKKNGHLSTVQIGRLFKKYAEDLDFPDDLKHPHTLRHSIAVHLAEAGYDVAIVQDHLRHSKIDSTLVYYQITSAKRIQYQTEAFNKLSIN